MAQHKRYFRLREHVGVEAPVLVESIDPLTGAPNEVENPKAGELAPIAVVGVRVAVPVLIDGQPAKEVVSVEITPDGAYRTIDDNGRRKRVGLPDTADKVYDAERRILELSSPSIIAAITHEEVEQYEEIAAPTKKPKEA